MSRAALGALLLAGLTVGCAPVSTVEAPAELKELSASQGLERLWREGLAGEDAEGLQLALAPVTDGERVYAAGRDGAVAAYALADGKRAWRTEVARLTRGSGENLGLWSRLWRPLEGATGQRFSAGPGLGRGLVLVGSSDGEVAALAADDGHLLWSVVLASELVATPATDGALVVVRLGSGQLQALDVQDGRVRWTAEQPVPVLSLRGAAPPVIEQGVVYAGFDNGKLAAYDLARGQLLWETPLATPTGRSDIERLVDADGTLAFGPEVVFGAAYHGRAAALDRGTGRLVWQRDLASIKGVAASGDAVFVTDSDSQVWALAASDGAPVWTQPDLRARGATSPAVVGDLLVVGDQEGYLHLMDRATGRMVGRARHGKAPIVVRPAVFGDLVLVQDAAGRLAVYRLVARS